MSTMKALSSFIQTQDPIEVRGSMKYGAEELTFRFELKDPQNKVLNSLKAAEWRETDLERADGLWQSTCFEAFWAEKGQKSYWEFNVSPNSPKWNLYQFNSYRQPSPPRPSQDFQLLSVRATSSTLECRLRTSLSILNIEASLCVVIKTLDGTHYFSTKHAGEKPDFHLRESFTL